MESNAIFVPILWMKKLKHGEIKALTPRYLGTPPAEPPLSIKFGGMEPVKMTPLIS